MASETGGPAFPCGKRDCDTPAVRRQGHQWLCAKHYRFGQMRTNAKAAGKAVPSHEELHYMPGADLVCPDCGRTMNWLAADGQATVASLQHYRDGTFAIVCRSCNTRHAYMPGDSFKDIPDDHKYCPCCNKSKPRDDFYSDNSRAGPLKTKSTCKTCSDLAVANYRRATRDQYNEYQRAYRAKRKAEGNPIARRA